MLLLVDAEFLLTKVPIAIATATFAIGLYQYIKAQHWKRCEFVAKEIKDFENNPLVRRAMFMLDFREGQFTPEKTFSTEGVAIRFDTQMLTKAVISHELRPEYQLTPEEIQVRLAFCDFFEGLERFNYFLDMNLVSKKNLEAYLPYWIARFSDPDENRKGKTFIYSIWTFIDTYEYTGVRKLAEQVARNNSKLLVPAHRDWTAIRNWATENLKPAS
jgi:hypothetical protein